MATHYQTKGPWTPDEDTYLKAHYKSASPAAIAQHLGRTRNAVLGRAYRVGLTTPQVRKGAPTVKGRKVPSLRKF